jgi:hypothetical protein
METGIYVGAVALTVVWSVYLHTTWSTRAKLTEEAGGRFFLIVGPSSYLLATVLSGWQEITEMRLDLVGLVLLGAIIILTWLVLLIYFAARHTDDTQGYKIMLVLYNVTSILVVAACWSLRLIPPFREWVMGLVEESRSIDLFSFAWVAMDTEGREPNLTSMLNRILIALLSYVPISLIRIAYGNRKRKRIVQEVDALRQRVISLEKHLQQGPTPRKRGSR